MQARAPQTVDEFDLQEQLAGLLSRVSAKTGKSRVVGEIDDDVINLVSMLFEFILDDRSEEHTSELQSLMSISYAVYCLKKKINNSNRNKYSDDHKRNRTHK